MLRNNKDNGLILGSFAVAFFATTPTINLIIARSFPNLSGVNMSNLYLISLVLILFSIFKKKGKIVKPRWSFWILLGSILVAFYLTRKKGVQSLLKPDFFFMFTVIPLIIPQLIYVDARKVLIYIASIPVIGVFFIPYVFLLSDSGMIGMDITYSFLLPIISALVYYFVYYGKDDSFVKKLMLPVFFVNLVYFLLCLLFGSRAPSLSVFLCLFFLLSTSVNQNSIGYRFKNVFWFLIIIIVALNFGDFLLSISNLFNQVGIESSTFDKMNELYKEGNLSDGRAAIMEDAIRGISLSPVFGHGLSASEPFTGYQYPHNFILQLLLDGGAILFLIVIVPMITYLIKGKSRYSLDEYALICVLFFGSVPGALFSLDLWENPRFWLFMGFLLSKYFRVYSCYKYKLLKI